jgi:hypothetical protein
LIRAQKEAVLAAVKRGEADCTYAFVGGGGFSIQNANSGEEVNQHLLASTMGLFYEFEVRPLAGNGQLMDTVAKAFEARERQSQ